MSAHQKQIAVLGSINIDMVTKVQEIPKINEVVISEGLKMLPGGKAFNAAVGISRLKEKVWVLGRIGNDSFGENLKKIFKKEGVNSEFVDIDYFVPTGTVMVNVDKQGRNTIIVNEGANIRISQQTIKDFLKLIDEKKLVIDCFYTTLETMPEIVNYAIEEFYKRKIAVFCDAAPTARPLNSKLYSKIDIISCNEIEIEVMTGIKVSNIENAEKAAYRLRQKGANIIVVTLGAKGALLLTDKTSYFPGIKVKVIDETGAGDAFRAGFVTEYLTTKDLVKAMDMGNKVGAYTVTKLGVYDAMPTKLELDYFRPSATSFQVKTLL